MTVLVNGTPTEIADGSTVADVVARLLSDRGGAAAAGVAVAVDDQVVRRPDWSATSLSPGARVEVLTAMQGG